jgi:Zn-dependent protease with chaperone function
MFFFELFEQLDLSDAKITVIMGHEIAHALHEHSREHMSQALSAQTAIGVGVRVLGLGQASADITATGSQAMVATRFSRSDEAAWVWSSAHVVAMTKVAAKKTAGVLGDYLAVNAQQVTGVKADRELPVVWAVAKGSFRNKAILVPAALLISAVAPWLITPLLMFGGAFLCYEGAEKLAHKYLHDAKAEHARTVKNLSDDPKKVVAKEKGAVRTRLYSLGGDHSYHAGRVG